MDEGDRAQRLLQGELSNGLEEGEPLDITGGASDFSDEDVTIVGVFFDSALNLIGDVGDYLNGLAGIDALALFFKDA